MEYFFNFNKIGYLKGKKPRGCILCLIREGSEAVDRLVVYENLHLTVSLNLYPYNPGHIIIFPRRHLTDIRSLDEVERCAMDKAVDLCLDVLDETYRPAGYNIGYNLGLVAGGSIEHLHLHIIPRYANEIGIAELLGGKKVLVQDPLESLALLGKAFASKRKNDEEAAGSC
ncbi:MAG: histidine triad (HIT) protein [Spirochaetae bacterium HGW-Spirochaetae-9]|nr:MAG: histidine triad (HIT) protein [Spirochaetae bacterium HGW-Spirochaetae-9]